MNDICSDEELKEIAEQWCDLVGEEFTASTLNAFVMGAKLAIANNGWINQNKEDGETDDPGQDIAIAMGR